MKYIIKTAKKLLPILCVIAGYGALMLLRRYKIVNPYMIQILMFAGVNIMMTVSLNLVNGFTGQFCIGHAGFMSLGAYGSAIVTTLLFPGVATSPALKIPAFLTGLFVGGVVAAVVGLLIGLPTLKLKGDYLAIVTLAFGEIVRAFLRLVEPIGAARGMVLLVDPGEGEQTPRVRASRNVQKEAVQDPSGAVSDSIVRQVIETRRSVIVCAAE